MTRHFEVGPRKPFAVIQRMTTEYYDRRAGTDPEYRLDAAQRAVWADDLRGIVEQHLRPLESDVTPEPDRLPRVLDVGTGAGAFAFLLAELGCDVVGIDGAEDAIAMGRYLLAGERVVVSDNVRLQHVTWSPPPGLARTPTAEDLPSLELPERASAEGYFDAVVSKQAICHLYDPIWSFELWRAWLRPGGKLILIDGLWQRSGWSDDLVTTVDDLPLSVTGGLGTVSYLLERAGFEVIYRRLLADVNRFPATRSGSGPLYAIVAQERG